MLKTLLSIGLFSSLSFAGPILTRDPRDYPADCVYPDYMIAPGWTGGSQDDVTLACLSKWKDGLLVTGIQTWNEDTIVKGIQVTYSDGSKSDVIGEMRGTGDTSGWDATDAISQAEIYGDGKGWRLGQLHFTTKSGQEFRLGNERTSGGFPYDVGGGLMMGIIVATTGDAIVRAGYLFMNGPISSVKATDFKFDDDIDQLNSQQTGITMAILQDGYFTNDKKEGNTTYNFINQIEVEVGTTTSWSNQHQIGVGMEWEFEADILGFAKVKNKPSIHYDYTRVDSKSSTQTEKRLLRWEASGNQVAPGKTIYCKASAQSGKFDGGYWATAHVTLQNGKEFTFVARGELKAVGWSESFASCEDVENPTPGVTMLKLPDSST